MKKLILFGFLLISPWVLAQKSVQRVELKIFVKELSQARMAFDDFLKKNPEIILLSYEDGNQTYYNERQILANILCDAQRSEILDRQVTTWGFLDSRKLSTLNNSFEIDKKKMELDFIKKRYQVYEKEIAQTDRSLEQYRTYFAELRTLENQIFALEKDIKALEQEVLNFSYQITFTQENGSPENSKINFVNMPGFQYSFLRLENPREVFFCSKN